ncbi:MAG: hypothetical protein LBT89_03435, partial [Planctomycetaceae bacterium]|nr:hypothetical protein [Planctomycetaceae bacterium]
MLVCSDTNGIAAYNLTQLQIIKETLRHRQPLASVLPSLGVRSESEAFQCLAVSLKMPLADLAKTEADADILNGFPAKLVHKYDVFPVGCQDSGALLVATANPFELQSLDAVSA